MIYNTHTTTVPPHKAYAKYHFIENGNNKLMRYYDKKNVVSLTIFKSGWKDKYQCILEWGEYENTDHILCTAEEIQKYYGISSFLRKDKLKKINESTL